MIRISDRVADVVEGVESRHVKGVPLTRFGRRKMKRLVLVLIAASTGAAVGLLLAWTVAK